MLKCMPIVVAFSEEIISFKVNILDAKSGIDNIHTMSGGGNGVFADNIGEASLILKRPTLTDETKVLYLDGYVRKGASYAFCKQTEREVIEACMQASNVIWE